MKKLLILLLLLGCDLEPPQKEMSVQIDSFKGRIEIMDTPWYTTHIIRGKVAGGEEGMKIRWYTDMYWDRTANNRRIKRWRLDDDREDNLYKAGHINHPSAVWCRETTANYFHLFSLYTATLAEFTYRYGKLHGASKPWLWLQRPPKNLKRDGFTSMPQAMPDYCKIVGDSIGAYRKYYINEKKRFATWKGKINGREIPEWYVSGRSLSA